MMETETRLRNFFEAKTVTTSTTAVDQIVAEGNSRDKKRKYLNGGLMAVASLAIVAAGFVVVDDRLSDPSIEDSTFAHETELKRGELKPSRASLGDASSGSDIASTFEPVDGFESPPADIAAEPEYAWVADLSESCRVSTLPLAFAQLPKNGLRLGVPTYTEAEKAGASEVIESQTEIIDNNTSSSKGKSHIARGRAHHKLGNSSAALADYIRGTELEPDWYKGWQLLGYYYELQGNDSLALENFSKSIELDQSDQWTYLVRGRTLLRIGFANAEDGDHDEAIANYSLAIADLTKANTMYGNEIGLDHRGNAYRHRSTSHKAKNMLEEAAKDDAAALADYENASIIRPDVSEFWHSLGYYYHAAGDYTKAVEHYSKAAEVEESEWTFEARASAYLRLGDIDFNNGSYSSATEWYSLAIEDFAQRRTITDVKYISYFKEGRAFFLRAQAKAALGQTSSAKTDSLKAQAVLDEGLAELKTSGRFLLLALVQIELAQNNEALKSLDASIQLSPSGVRAYHTRGYLKAQQGDLEGAVADFSRAIELDADYSFAYVGRAEAYASLGETEKAKTDFDSFETMQSSCRS